MTHAITSPNGTPVSRYAFGTMQFGAKADSEQSKQMFQASLEAGITHFDTAYVYADGDSERLLAQYIAPHRDGLVIATKVGFVGGAGRDNLLAQFDQSQQRLNLDCIDILYLHRFDPNTDLRETLDTFAELRTAGKIKHIGLSNFAAWQVMHARTLAAERNLTIDVLQPMYSLVKRQAEVELLPMCAAFDILPATYSPLGGGLLTGKYTENSTQGRLHESKSYATRYGVDWMHQAAAELKSLATELNVSPITLAIAWSAKHPSQPSPILSASSASQLTPSLDALQFELNDELYKRLTALTPTPPPATDRLDDA